ncbi:hypothetical protein B0T14DRAFT_1197 [Immersiella caudata]|uniref:MYND-type domain-containing protein n=1 Tax=Immersiella caudata TaxID=314043 RepID=A0AA39XDC1_9PEZI|nr:hypothetical protein B0T14DRAFT_1197 [Immersiella caudata]
MESTGKPIKRRAPKPNEDEHRDKFLEEMKWYTGGKRSRNPELILPKPKRETTSDAPKKTAAEESPQKTKEPPKDSSKRTTQDPFGPSRMAKLNRIRAQRTTHQLSGQYAYLKARWGSGRFAPEFPIRALNELYKQRGLVRKHDIVAKIPTHGTIGWDRTPIAPLPHRFAHDLPSWKSYPPDGDGTQPKTPLNEHEEASITGPNLPRRFRRHPSKTRVKPPPPPPEEPWYPDPRRPSSPLRLGDFPRPPTPTSHWDRDAWPRDTSILPFTIPLSSINRLDGIKHTKIRELCEVDSLSHHKRCVMCKYRSKSRWKCTGCDEAWYCGPSCKADDEPMHKLLCAAFAPNGGFTDRFRQSHNHFRALVWPAKSKTPELRWIHIHHSSSSSSRKHPLDSDSDSDSPSPRGPSFSFHYPEFWAFAKEFPKSAFTPHMFTLGCLNQALVFKHRSLGSGLFLLEWFLPQPTTDLPPTWINQSITSLGAPGSIFYWPGPLLIISLDTSRPYLSLRDITPRDVRHVIDYLQLTTRNPVLCDDLLRFPPEEHSLALKLTDTAQPVAQAMDIPRKPSIMQVVIPSSPPFANEGLSAICAGLELNWIFRDAICHGSEFDWLYDRSNTGTVVSPSFRGIYAANSDPKAFLKDPRPKLATLLSSGDGIIVAHRTGRMLHPEHLSALIEYLGGWRIPVRASPADKAALAQKAKALFAEGKAGFQRFWVYYRKKEALVGLRDIPSPYELEEGYDKGMICVGKMVGLGMELSKKKALGRYLELEREEEEEGKKGKGAPRIPGPRTARSSGDSKSAPRRPSPRVSSETRGTPSRIPQLRTPRTTRSPADSKDTPVPPSSTVPSTKRTSPGSSPPEPSSPPSSPPVPETPTRPPKRTTSTPKMTSSPPVPSSSGASTPAPTRLNTLDEDLD